MTSPLDPSQPPPQGPTQPDPDVARLALESRPPAIFAALYDRLPFPHLGPMQEVAFDLGVTALGAIFELTGLVVRGYAGHQMLFEQRWPARVIRLKVGLDSLEIPPGTGIALRGLHFMLHGYELLSHLEVTVVGKDESTGESRQSQLQIAVTFPSQATDVYFPLEGSWWAIQAADWSDLHKSEPFSQPYAVDFVRLGPDNAIYQGSGARLEEHYSWDQPVYATAGGKIAYACYDMPDLAPGAAPDPAMMRGDPRRLLGNAVAISHANGEFSYFAALQQAGLAVRQGEMVQRNALLGRVGNSGYSPGPHLHFHLMDGPNLMIDRGLPVRFSHFAAGGEFFDAPTFIPTRMIVTGPPRSAGRKES